MKRIIITSTTIAAIIITSLIVNSCTEDLPLAPQGNNLITLNISSTSVAGGTAEMSGSFVNYNAKLISETGFCWSTNENPSINEAKISAKVSNDSIQATNISGLEPSTKYYVRGYAMYGTTPIYSNQFEFTTTEGLPQVSTTDITNITAITATSGGTIIDDGGFEITACGVCWSTKQNPTIEDSLTIDDINSNDFVSELANLNEDTKYYVRAYATNKGGTAYGNEASFLSQDGQIQLTTAAVTNITFTSATSGGVITDDGGIEITSRGICYSTNSSPTISDNKIENGKGVGNFISELTGLTGETSYYVRAYAINSKDTTYGNELNFTTQNGLPELTTIAITDIIGNTAKSGGNITSDGGYAITARGVCFSTSTNPTIANTKTVDGAGIGTFTSTLSDLTLGSIYYVRAYATNSIGTVYGDEKTFTVLDGLPRLSTIRISNITDTSAQSGGNISSDGGFAITARGVCWSLKSTPIVDDSITEDGTGTGTFSSILTGLSPNKRYYVRAYATNCNGTAYGDILNFDSDPGNPILTTTAITAITATTAQSGGNILSDGGYAINSGGVCWSTKSNPTTEDNKTSDANGLGVFTSSLSELEANTTYYVRAYATTNARIGYGTEQTFTTEVGLPHLITNEITNITESTALSGGDIINNGGYEITAKGICWSTNSSPTINDNKTEDGTGMGAFTSNITGLSDNTAYYVRAYASNSAGTAYGTTQSFIATSEMEETFIDFDGNTYNIVRIGTQFWMGENLKTTHYPDGSSISLVTDNAEWVNLGDNNTDEAYCYYDNNNSSQYGGLYTYAAAIKACPTGWHLPSDAEWTTLENNISNAGHSGKEGTVLKATSGWHNNSNGTDNYGFSALPSGTRISSNGEFQSATGSVYWWASTESTGSYAYTRNLSYLSNYIKRNNNYKSTGYSVRCIKD